MLGARANHLRGKSEHGHHRVTYVELFFDLVFVFAITQLSHSLLEHLTPLGALQTALLMIAVWWAWIDTAWITNWLDPDRASVRLLLFALMLAGLVLSASIPKAFADRAVPFALAYVSMQAARNLFMLWALRRHDHGNFLNFLRITIWHAASVAVLDRGLLRRGLRAAGPVGGCGRHRVRSRRWSASGCRGSAARPRRTGTSKAATWPSAARCSSSSRSASRS